MVVRNSNHFGAAGYYTLRLAEEGLISLVSSNGPPIIAAPGSAGPVLANQPTSYGLPDPDGQGAVVLDIALSVVAGTKIMQLNDFDNFAILGNNVTGFTLADSIINAATANGDLEAPDTGEGSVRFTNLTGIASITNSKNEAAQDSLKISPSPDETSLSLKP